MKRLSEAKMLWLLRRQKLMRTKQYRRSGSAKMARRSAARARSTRLSVIPVPRFLTAERDTHRKEIHQTIRTVSSVLRTPGRRALLDFSRTEKIFPGGMLLLLAHLQLVLEKHPGRITARCPPRSLAAQLMNHFGIADRLGISPRSSHPTHDSVIHWRYCCGTVADGAKIAEVLQSYRQSTCAEIPEGLYDVLTEALTNVRHHAYSIDGNVPDSLKQWWLFARYVEPRNGAAGNLYIAVYDVGVGIQKTMRRRLETGEILLAKTDDLFGWTQWRAPHKRLEKLLLLRAVEHSRTSTGEDFRGKGLPEMRDFVLQTKTGRLYIISGSAQYVCNPASAPSMCKTNDERTDGTLILWSIPLQYKDSI